MDAEVAYWKDEIDTYERLFDKFLRRGRKIQKKYKDIRSNREESATRYNILWANVQTRLPALYARNPKVVVERRFRDADPVGRLGAEVLERSIQYTLDHVNDAWQVNRQVVLDYELPGRGTVWVRYVPHFKKAKLDAAAGERREGLDGASDVGQEQMGGRGSEVAPMQAAQPMLAAGEPPAQGGRMHELEAHGTQISNVAEDQVQEETLSYEEAKLDYVYWEDYGHSWARVDDEVRGKWRRVYMDREELEERFMRNENNPDGLTQREIDAIPLDWSPKSLTDSKIPMTRKKAIVYEIWDKRRRNALWMVKNYPKLLDKREDMLGLDGFFPCPRMLAANLCNDDMMPSPNFTFYQDQANEIDELSTRIVAITKALKVAGVRDTSAEGLDRLLSEGVENQLIPVEGWAVLKEKGGLAGTFELLPMDMIVTTLQSIRDQRKEAIEDVYQLTGISDIVRGMSDPDETATAQQLKGQFSMIRIEDAQAEVQRFCRDEIVILGQIVAGFDIETLKAISGVKLLTAAEKQDLQMQLAAIQRQQQMQAAMAQGQQAAGPPPPGAPPASPAGPAPFHPPMAAPAPGPVGPPVPSHQGPPAGAAPAPPPMQPPHPGMQLSAPAAQPPAGPPQQMPQMTGGMHPGAPSAPMTPAPGQAPPSPEKMKLLELPTWEEVGALLENPVLREFRLDIETDSTIKMDEEAEKSARMELIKNVGSFVQQMVEAGQQAPEILPMLGELLMFGVRAFKTARSVEQTFDDMLQALEKAAKAPKPPPPEVQKAQADAAAAKEQMQLKAQTDIQIAQGQQAAQEKQSNAEIQSEMQRDQMKAQLDADTTKHVETVKSQAAQTLAELTQHFDAQKTQWQTQAQERIASADNATKLKIAEMAQEHQKQMTRMQQQHDAREGDKQRDHERSMPKPKAAA